LPSHKCVTNLFHPQKNRLLEAKHLFLTVLDCQRKAHGELHEDVGSALHNVGLVHLRANEYGEALTHFERAVRVRKGSLGREHPEVAVSQVKVGITLLLMHSFDSALQAFVEALSIRKRALGDLHASNAAIYCNIGCVHVEFNELRDARRAFEAALDIQRNALYHEPDSGPLMFGTATTLCNLGYLYRYREMHQKVAMVLKEALSVSVLIRIVHGSLHFNAHPILFNSYKKASLAKHTQLW
jgi:tetratricopeptide (TPR) repeat protein